MACSGFKMRVDDEAGHICQALTGAADPGALTADGATAADLMAAAALDAKRAPTPDDRAACERAAKAITKAAAAATAASAAATGSRPSFFSSKPSAAAAAATADAAAAAAGGGGPKPGSFAALALKAGLTSQNIRHFAKHFADPPFLNGIM